MNEFSNKSILSTCIILLSFFTFTNLFSLDNQNNQNTPAPKGKLAKIEPFGYKFLSRAPSNQKEVIVVMHDYLLKPGDELVIDVWGDIDLHYKLPVSKDGFIDIERVGRVYIQGMKYVDAKKKITRALGKTYELFINPENPGAGSSLVDISLGKSVGMVIYVTGAVQKPGSIHVNSTSASVLNALLKAGGVNRSGSLRNIKISKLGSEKNLTLDLYDFLLNGKFQEEFKYLNDGDIIFVPYKGRTAGIDGEIKNSAEFELLPKENIDDLIKYAGGFKSDAIKLEIIRKNLKNSSFAEITLDNVDKGNISEAIDTPLIDGDKIYVYGIDEIRNTDYVIVKGNVTNPGRKEVYAGITLEEIIMNSGGFKDEADISNIEIIRKETKDLSGKSKFLKIDFSNPSNKKFKLKKNDIVDVRMEYNLVNNNTVNITGSVPRPGSYNLTENETLQSIIERAGNIKNGLKEGKIELSRDGLISSFSISKIIKPGNNEFIIQLKPNDKITISPREPWVVVQGNVNKPGRYIFKNEMDFTYYLDIAKGLKSEKQINKVIIETYDGEILDGEGSFWSISNPKVPMDSKIFIL